MDYGALPPKDLAVACLESGNELAWAEFVRRFQPLIARVVFRVSRQWGESSSEAIDDLVQETYLKLCGGGLSGLRKFKPTHEDAIYGYIKVFTANLAHDRFKAARSQKRGGRTIVDSIDRENCSPTRVRGSALSDLERDVLIQQVDSCLNRVASGPDLERDRRIFWLYYRIGLTASAIASIPGIALGVKGVESTILRLTRQIKVELVAGGTEPRVFKRSGKRDTN